MRLFYKIGYIDLKESEESLWDRVDGRTEVRLARKNGIVIELISGRPENIQRRCAEILRNLLKSEVVAYSKKFDEIIGNPEKKLLAAFKDSLLVSFIVIGEYSSDDIKGRGARLELSATDMRFRRFCPNYLLIWEATRLLRAEGYDYFNLDLLNYAGAPDPDLEQVGFFKRKWALTEIVRAEDVSLFKYLYVRFFKRFRLVKRFAYLRARQ